MLQWEKVQKIYKILHKIHQDTYHYKDSYYRDNL